MGGRLPASKGAARDPPVPPGQAPTMHSPMAKSRGSAATREMTNASAGMIVYCTHKHRYTLGGQGRALSSLQVDDEARCHGRERRASSRTTPPPPRGVASQRAQPHCWPASPHADGGLIPRRTWRMKPWNIRAGADSTRRKYCVGGVSGGSGPRQWPIQHCTPPGQGRVQADTPRMHGIPCHVQLKAPDAPLRRNATHLERQRHAHAEHSQPKRRRHVGWQEPLKCGGPKRPQRRRAEDKEGEQGDGRLRQGQQTAGGRPAALGSGRRRARGACALRRGRNGERRCAA